MENDDTGKGGNQAPEELTTSSASVDAENQKRTPKQANNKTRKYRRWSLWQHWKRAKSKTRLKWFSEGIGVLLVGALVFNAVWQNLQSMRSFEAEHRPKIVFSRPPEFVTSPAPDELNGTLVCKVFSAENRVSLQVGTVHTWLTNIGKGDADGVWLSPIARIDPISEKYKPLVNDDSCKRAGKPIEKLFAVYHGTEVTVPLRQIHSENMFPAKEPIAENAGFYFYFADCVNYSSSDPEFYRSCVTYRLRVKGREGNRDPFMFQCDGQTITGDFVPTFAGYCEK